MYCRVVFFITDSPFSILGDFSALKLAILVNPVRVSERLAAAIKAKLQVGGKTVMYFDAVAVVDGEGNYTPEGARKLTGLDGLTQGPADGVDASTSTSATTPMSRMTRFVDPGAPATDARSSWPPAAAAVWSSLVDEDEPCGSSWPATPYWWLNASRFADGATVLVLGHFDQTSVPSPSTPLDRNAPCCLQRACALTRDEAPLRMSRS